MATDTNKAMTLGEFDHPAMEWAMYDEANADAVDQQIMAEGRWNDEYLESPEGSERVRQAYRSNLLELETTAPDGIHYFTVHFDSEGAIFYGVVVKDGKFDPILTAHAIHIAMVTKRNGKDLHHRFVEMLEWMPTNSVHMKGYFVVGLGS